jgi:hypothetical protein
MNSESAPRRKVPWYHISRLTWELLVFGALLIVIGVLYMMNRSKQELLNLFAKASIDLYADDSKRDKNRLRDLRLMAILLSEETQRIDLQSRDHKTEHIRAFVNMRLGIALVGSRIPQPGQNHTYQLWAFSRAQYTMNSDQGLFISKKEFLFTPDPTGELIFLTDRLTDFQDVFALSITEEPAGGSPRPTQQNTWSGDVRIGANKKPMH